MFQSKLASIKNVQEKKERVAVSSLFLKAKSSIFYI